MQTPLKVGELADRTNLTVRTLHHYDEIGLLSPSRRSSSGHRLYDTAEIARLQQIKSLQQLGFSLEQIGALLDREDFPALRVVEMHLRQARAQLERQQVLVDRLQRIAATLETAGQPSADLLIHSIEAMTMFDKYYTPEQMEYLEQRREQVGEQRIAEVQREWQQLYADAQAEVENGTDPADEAAQRLVRRWNALIAEFTGGDAGIRASLGNMWQQESQVREQWGPPAEVMEFIKKAMAAAGD
ncbi:MAG: MerR family transcriptional regulator [Acidobacteriota bacterium]|jgi:DNA-binding transcriptional MerR regulator